MSHSAALTRNQAIVLDVLRTSHAAMGAYQILERTAPQGLRAPPQVYRALDKLIDLKLVHRIDRLNAYVHCEHGPHDHDVALAVCETCGSVTEIDLPPSVDDSIGEQLASHGFARRDAKVEIVGHCHTCTEAGR